MRKAASLAKQEGIVVNNDVRKQGIHLDRAVVIKEISMNTPKGMIKAVVKFAESSQADLLATRWLFLIRKDSVRMAKAASRDQFRVLLFTLPVGTTAHDFGNLLEEASGKTCVINQLLESGNRTHCAVVGFKSDEMLESAFCTCDRHGKLGYSVLECDAEIAFTLKPPKSFIKQITLDENCLQLAKLYVKKSVPISYPAAFGGKSWAQVISSASMSFGLFVDSELSLFSSSGLGSDGLPPSTFLLNSALNECLSSLEQFLGLLSDQVSCILKCLDGTKLVSLVSVSNGTPAVSVSQPLASVLSVVANSNSLSDIVLDSPDSLFNTPLLIATDGPVLGSSSSKVLTFKLGSLESKFVALEVLEVAKTIDYVFVLSNLINVILDCGVAGVKEFFDTDHRAVFVSVGLGGLLDVQLNSLHKQANRDCWKFNVNNADRVK
ncbi:hypothetical protein G9A89_023294 [Geosiphon pyriformis]|nr:hypothetical protein G9A89_023294 [Geosiphon pyriformis]